jgi:uncharacterized protein YbjQ (UPF0145 family)
MITKIKKSNDIIKCKNTKKKNTINKNTKKGGNDNILLSSLSNLPDNYEILYPGIITGRSIHSLGTITSFLSGLSRFTGSKQNWTGVEKKLDEVRDEAIEHLIKKSKQYSPDAIFGLNIELSEIASGSSNALLVCSVAGTMCRKI